MPDKPEGLEKKAQREGYGWIACSVVLVCIAQLAMKYGMNQLPAELGLDSYRQLMQWDLLLAAGTPIALGMLCYVLSVGCWITTLERLPLSVAYPLLSVSYILVYLAAVALPFFDESLSTRRLLGILLLCVGVIFVSFPNRGQTAVSGAD